LRKSILVSTSYEWNPGDDFIREGVLSLVSNIHDYNWYYWNRHKYVSKDTGQNHLLPNITASDYFLFAGTPQWLSNNESIWHYFTEKGKRASLIGVGSYDPAEDLNVYLKLAAEKNLVDIAVARDVNAKRKLENNGISCEVLPCPAGLWVNKFIKRQEVKKIGINYLHLVDLYNVGHSYEWDKRYIDLPKYYEFFKNLYNELEKKYEIKIICHNNGDVWNAKKFFPNSEIFYSFHYPDYYEWYKDIDLMISGRVHGSIIPLNMGTPTLFFGVDYREATFDEFVKRIGIGAKKISLGNIETGDNFDQYYHDVVNWINVVASNYKDINSTLEEFYYNVRKEYSHISTKLNQALHNLK